MAERVRSSVWLPISCILLKFVCAYGSETGHDTENDDDHHEHEVLVFMFGALLVGTTILHLTTLPSFHSLQFTVVLFVTGVIFSLVAESGVAGKEGMVYRSYEAWVNIDPHLLLFVFLPPLLFGDAMAMDTHIARRASRQCVILAGPGVAIGAISTAFVVQWLYEWDFATSLAAGSILAATDPVAVVSLLKELGAPPTLTTQIQGESLLNDGTSIVLFSIAYHFAGGNTYSAGEIIVVLLKSVIGAPCLGVLVGVFFLQWIRGASDKLNHNSSLIQISLTIGCSYWSFYLAEGVFHISGVLSTVSGALVLAHKMWPAIVAKPAMQDIWHVIESFGNTLVFFLAGAMTGKVTMQTDYTDYIRLIVVYIAAIFIRFLMLLILWPALNYAGKKVTLKDIIIMTWGGLRGMVGLAMAIFVQKDRAGGQISDEDGDRILFLVGGIAALTLIVNASTSPALARCLRITTTPAARKVLINNVADRAQAHVYSLYDELLRDPRNRTLCYAGELNIMVGQLNDSVREHLPPVDNALEELVDEKEMQKDNGWNRQTTVESSHTAATIKSWISGASTNIDVEGLWTRFHERKTAVIAAGTANICLFQYEDQLDSMKEILQTKSVDKQRLQVVREVFLETLRVSYWEQVQKGRIASTSDEPTLLLNSVNIAKERCNFCLSDWEILNQDIAFKLNAEDELLTPVSSRRSVHYPHGRKSVTSLDINISKTSSIDELFKPASRCGTLGSRIYWWWERRKRKNLMEDQALAIHCILAFLQAHSYAQEKIALYFGDDAEVDTCEEAYVILESQEEAYMAAEMYSKISKAVQMRVNTTSEFLRIAEQYRSFVISVHKSGVIQSKEAELLLHPMSTSIRQILRARRKSFQAIEASNLNDYDAALRIQRCYRKWRFLRVVRRISDKARLKLPSGEVEQPRLSWAAATAKDATGPRKPSVTEDGLQRLVSGNSWQRIVSGNSQPQYQNGSRREPGSPEHQDKLKQAFRGFNTQAAEPVAEEYLKVADCNADPVEKGVTWQKDLPKHDKSVSVETVANRPAQHVDAYIQAEAEEAISQHYVECEASVRHPHTPEGGSDT